MRFPKLTFLSVFLLAALVVHGAYAGEKCTEDADVCARMMKEKLQHRGWVGIWIDDEERESGLLIKKVVPDSPAAASGLLAGDRILALNGIAYSRENEKELKGIYHQVMKPENTIVYRIRRESDELDISIELAEMPDELIERLVGHHILEYHSQSEEAGHEN